MHTYIASTLVVSKYEKEHMFGHKSEHVVAQDIWN